MSKSPVMARFSRQLLADMPVYLAGLFLLAVVIAMAGSKGVAIGWDGIAGNAFLFFAIGVFLVLGDAPIALVRNRPARPFSYLQKRYFSAPMLDGMLAGAPFVLTCIVLLPVFSAMKSMIPLFNPYTWDRTFIEADRFIFLGYDAWQVIQPVIGYPLVTSLITYAYHGWFLLLYAGVYFFAFGRIERDIRRRFFFCYVLSWCVIGGLMATALASVGPCFLAPIVGDHTFDALMAYLNEANRHYPVMVLDVQRMLLEGMQSGETGLGSGITAMPSMHVAVVVAFWLAGRKINRRAGNALLAFLIVIWVGSVHTGYHYFVDGLVSIIVVSALWRFSGPMFQAWDRLLARQAAARPGGEAAAQPVLN